MDKKDSIIMIGSSGSGVQQVSSRLKDIKKKPVIDFESFENLPTLEDLTRRSESASGVEQGVLAAMLELRKMAPGVKNLTELGFDAKVYDKIQEKHGAEAARLYKKQFQVMLLKEVCEQFNGACILQLPDSLVITNDAQNQEIISKVKAGEDAEFVSKNFPHIESATFAKIKETLAEFANVTYMKLPAEIEQWNETANRGDKQAKVAAMQSGQFEQLATRTIETSSILNGNEFDAEAIDKKIETVLGVSNKPKFKYTDEELLQAAKKHLSFKQKVVNFFRKLAGKEPIYPGYVPQQTETTQEEMSESVAAVSSVTPEQIAAVKKQIESEQSASMVGQVKTGEPVVAANQSTTPPKTMQTETPATGVEVDSATRTDGNAAPVVKSPEELAAEEAARVAAEAKEREDTEILEFAEACGEYYKKYNNTNGGHELTQRRLCESKRQMIDRRLKECERERTEPRPDMASLVAEYANPANEDALVEKLVNDEYARLLLAEVLSSRNGSFKCIAKDDKRNTQSKAALSMISRILTKAMKKIKENSATAEVVEEAQREA